MTSATPHSRCLRSKTLLVVTLVLSVTLLASCEDATAVVHEQAQLAFVRDSPYDTLFVVSPETGELEQQILLPLVGHGVHISPDGHRIAITASGPELWLMNMDGSDARSLGRNASGGAWSRDGTRLAYRRYPGPEIRIVNADGSGDVAVPGAVPGGFGGISWSPDGRRIAFEGMRANTRTIYVVNIDGSGLRDIDLTLPGAEVRASGEPAWSPDGRRIAFSRREFYNLNRIETRVWIANLSTRAARPITTSEGLSDYRPAWSPDGSQIAFLRFTGERSDVYVVRPDGAGLQRITDTPTMREEFPQWVRRKE